MEAPDLSDTDSAFCGLCKSLPRCLSFSYSVAWSDEIGLILFRKWSHVKEGKLARPGAVVRFRETLTLFSLVFALDGSGMDVIECSNSLLDF